MTDIKIGLIDLQNYTDTKEIRYDYYTIGPENVAEAMGFIPRWDWYADEKYTVLYLMLAGF